MSAKPGPHLELIEPLQSFLENLTQELTEQKFIPAFRDELQRMITAVDNLQQSEDTLQQIARGVERLRDVFGPAGTRLSEGVRDLEILMRGHTDELKGQAEQVLKDLGATHTQLESALRGEAELLQGQSSASRDAISRVTAEMEARLSSLNQQLDSLFRRLESEAAQVRASAPVNAGESPAPAAVTPVSAVQNVTMTEDLREAFSRTENVVLEELKRYRKEVGEKISREASERAESISQLDRSLSETVGTVGTKVRDELDHALSRLRDQIQMLVSAQVEARSSAAPAAPSGTESAGTVAPEALSAAFSATEFRILQELDAARKQQSGDVSGLQRVIQEVERNFSDAARKQTDRISEQADLILDCVSNLEAMARESRENERVARERVAQLGSSVESSLGQQREQWQSVTDKLGQVARTSETDSRRLDDKVQEDRQSFANILSALGRAEQAATSAAELAATDSRVLREKIEGGLRDVREQIEKALHADFQKTEETLATISEVWLQTLESLREFIHETVTKRAEEIILRTTSMENRIADADRSRESFQSDMRSELSRSSARFEEQLHALRESSATFTSAMETHVKVVSSEVSALRSKQEQSLAVLREAIRANYDDNAARLKDVIDAAAEQLVKQVATIPQALDRYVHLIQSMTQSEQIALEAISRDTKNILSVSSEKLDAVVADIAAVKKFYPILDKKFEKQLYEFESLRKSNSETDKNMEELRKALTNNAKQQDNSRGELKDTLFAMEQQTAQNFQETQDLVRSLQDGVKAVIADELPGFRKELSNVIGTKFEFMESTQSERQAALRAELTQRLDNEKRSNSRIHILLGLLITLSIVLQVVFHWSAGKGLTP